MGQTYARVAGTEGRVETPEGPVVWAWVGGRASARGQHGHLGDYDREFRVDSVEGMSAEPPPGACARPASVRP